MSRPRFTQRCGVRDVPSGPVALPQPKLCQTFGAHWWWPLKGHEQRATGVRSVCLRCGSTQPRAHMVPVGQVRVTRAVVALLREGVA